MKEKSNFQEWNSGSNGRPESSRRVVSPKRGSPILEDYFSRSRILMLLSAPTSSTSRKIFAISEPVAGAMYPPRQVVLSNAEAFTRYHHRCRAPIFESSSVMVMAGCPAVHELAKAKPASCSLKSNKYACSLTFKYNAFIEVKFLELVSMEQAYFPVSPSVRCTCSCPAASPCMLELRHRLCSHGAFVVLLLHHSGVGGALAFP